MGKFGHALIVSLRQDDQIPTEPDKDLMFKYIFNSIFQLKSPGESDW